MPEVPPQSENEKSLPVDPDKEPTPADFSTLIPEAEDRKKFVEAAGKPTTRWTTRHKGPYYRAKFALQIRTVLDAMMQDRKKRIYRYRDYPELSHNTLYLRIIQSKAYLLDNLDSTNKYKDFCEGISVSKQHGCGVIVELREDNYDGTSAAGTFAPSVLDGEGEDWKNKLEEYLLSYEKSTVPLEITGIALTPEQIYEIELQLAQLQDVSYRVTEDKIVVIKI